MLCENYVTIIIRKALCVRSLFLVGYEMCILIALGCNFKMLKVSIIHVQDFAVNFPEKEIEVKGRYITLFLSAREEKLSILTS